LNSFLHELSGKPIGQALSEFYVAGHQNLGYYLEQDHDYPELCGGLAILQVWGHWTVASCFFLPN